MNNPQAVDAQNPQGAVSVSPDRRRYVFRVLRGDIKRNGVWAEIYSGELTSLHAATSIKKVTELFTTGRGSGGFEFLGPDLDVSEIHNPIRWLTSDQIAFLWSDEREIPQAVRVDLNSQKVVWMTNHPSPVGAFDVSASGVVLYNAKAMQKPSGNEGLLKQGFIIPDSADAYALFRHDPFGGSAIDLRMNTEWFTTDASMTGMHARPLDIAGRAIDSTMLHRVNISPDSRHAIVNTAPLDFPDAWSQFTQREMKGWIEEAKRDPRAMMARLVQQLYVVDLVERTSRPLWAAPSFGVITRAEWAPDSRRVVVAPAFLPVEIAQSGGFSGTAAAVVDIATGNAVQLPIVLEPFEELASLRWLSPNQIELSRRVGSSVEVHLFNRREQDWYRQTRKTPSQTVRLEVREDLETPPVLIATDPKTEQSRTILDPNPGIADQFAWGKAKRIDGRLPDGTNWEALLFYPLDYEAGKRYPMVIQSFYGPLASNFSLYGYGSLGPSEIAPYPGRILANRGMFVLHQTVELRERFGTPEEARIRAQAFEAAIWQLSSSQLIDTSRVGLLGFSRNGYYVEYALTHSSFPYAAAIAADNFDPSYFPMTLMVDVLNGTQINGSKPFGKGLLSWLDNAPGFAAENVRTPLRKIEQSFGLFGALLKWEMFSRLRYLKRPVELYVVPDYQRGAHNTQNPRQVIAVQQGSVEWFDFWLNKYEDPAPEKAGQYNRWRRLRQLATDLSASASSSNSEDSYEE